ncbi:MAG: hypothetical protein JSS66_14190 [Armatimonadetes bacterium]|nr:hypothetical protein [Armatimonadota bacterium]
MKVSRPILYTAVLGLVAYAVVVLTEPDKKPKGKSTAVHKKAPGAKADQFLEADYKAKFTPVSTAPKNAFKPLVVREGEDNQLQTQRFDSIPSAFTGGDPNWLYTGTATVDGVRVALVENSASGEGVFLKVGEMWKQAVLTSIEDEGIIMVGPGGAVRHIKLGFTEQPAAPAPMSGNVPLTVTPSLNGPIGQGQGGSGGGTGTPRNRDRNSAQAPFEPNTE